MHSFFFVQKTHITNFVPKTITASPCHELWNTTQVSLRSQPPTLLHPFFSNADCTPGGRPLSWWGNCNIIDHLLSHFATLTSDLRLHHHIHTLEFKGWSFARLSFTWLKSDLVKLGLILVLSTSLPYRHAWEVDAIWYSNMEGKKAF